MWKQSSRLRSCTLCVQGSAQKRDVAKPPCRPPRSHPSCTRRERRTRAKGSGVFDVGPSVPLTQGLRSSRGRRHSPLPLIPWRRHGSRLGEARCEKAACCSSAVTSLGWRPTCRVGPRDPATPFGLAGGGEPWRLGLHRSLAHSRGMAVRRGLAGVPLSPHPPPCEVAGWLPRMWRSPRRGRPTLSRPPAGGGGRGGGVAAMPP